MIELYPPDDPYLLNTTLTLGVILLVIGGFLGAMTANWFFESRTKSQSEAPPASVNPATGWLWLAGGIVAGLLLVFVGLHLFSPEDPYIIHIAVPLQVRWYGVCIIGGALLGTWINANRARLRGFHPDHSWNQLMLGLILGVIGARIYYVIFQWHMFRENPWMIPNLMTGGLAIHGAIIGAILSVAFYTWRNQIPFWQWLDIHVPGFLLAQGIGRWGNFFNQEAYGRPTDLGLGVRIDPIRRVAPYQDLQQFPPHTLFHATFLYESLWNISGAILLIVIDRLWGTNTTSGNKKLRHGDLFFLYCIIYSSGRFWIEGLRTDSLLLSSLRIAQVMSIVMILAGIGAILYNHRKSARG